MGNGTKSSIYDHTSVLYAIAGALSPPESGHLLDSRWTVLIQGFKFILSLTDVISDLREYSGKHQNIGPFLYILVCSSKQTPTQR